MNAKPLHPTRLLLLLFCLSLALLVFNVAAQHRAQPRTAQPKPKPTKPTPTTAPNKPAQTATTQTGRHVTVRWRGQPGIDRYRLQVGRDTTFRDIVFDRAVVGLEAQVELPAGDHFFWHVAPAAEETGEFSAPEPIIMETTSAGPKGTLALLRSPLNVGWQAVTGEVLRPQVAALRGSVPDVVAVNNEGTIFALDGTNGSALWTARYRPNARRGEPPVVPAEVFTPIVVRPAQTDKASVVVAFDGGVRALEGETGRELWRLGLPGAAVSGTVGDLQGDGALAGLAVVTTGPELYFIDARTGQSSVHVKLDAVPIGPPVPFITNVVRGVALTLAGGMLDVRRVSGERFRAVKFDVPFTTPPVVIAGPKGVLLIVGSAHGLLYLDGETLKPLGKITTPDDMPRGRLAAADLDHDNLIEVIAPMKSGKIVVVSAEGHILWTADGAEDAYSPAFADLDGDGVLDVLVASSRSFARGFSGRDGSLIWQVDDATGATNAAGEAALRSLIFIPVGQNNALIVSGDAAHTGVRAVGLPQSPVKMAAQ
jgi:PQQ-like domain